MLISTVEQQQQKLSLLHTEKCVTDVYLQIAGLNVASTSS